MAATLAISLGLGLFLGIVGPFGSYLSIELPARISHFVGVALSTSLLISGSLVVISRFIYRAPPPYWVFIGVAIVMAWPTAVVVQASLAILSPKTLAYVTFNELLAQTLFLNLLVNAVAAFWTLHLGRGEATEAAAIASAAAADARFKHIVPRTLELTQREPVSTPVFSQALPATLRSARVLSLTAEDHYLRVRTSRGETLILMAIGEAEASLDGLGIRIHRSHWVAFSAIDGWERSQGRDFVRVGETLLPVARNRRRDVLDIANRPRPVVESLNG